MNQALGEKLDTRSSNGTQRVFRRPSNTLSGVPAPTIALERYGYAKARRIGMAAMIGGKDKTKIREATPSAFRDVLLAMAASAVRPFTQGGVA